MLQPHDITDYFINNYLHEGDTAIDATAGNGNDTLKLCKKVGHGGRVFAFDIQKAALERTQNLLESEGFNNAEYILDSHSDMDKYVHQNVGGVLFNLGYLPGGDHKIQTKAETSISAIEKAMNIINDDGFVSVTIYYGKNSGTEEKNAVMEYLNHIDYKKFTVTIHDFYNRPNNPPITAIITKNNGR